MAALAAQKNADLNLIGKTAVVTGGTQGIGAAVASRFASGGASVYVVGRNQELGSKVVEELRAASKDEGAAFEFIQADLSLIKEIKSTASSLQQKTGSKGVDYLVETQGGPPNGRFSLTEDGQETHFAVQILSRFGIASLLADSGTLKNTVVFVAAPGGSDTAPDVEDVGLLKAQKEGKFGLMASAKRDSWAMDAITHEFNERYPNLRARHFFPGMVATGAIVSSGILPGPLATAASWVAPYIMSAPATVAEIPVYLATNKEPRSPALFDNKLKPVKVPKWIVDEPEKRTLLWESLAKLIK